MFRKMPEYVPLIKFVESKDKVAKLRQLVEVPHLHHGGQNECSICDRSLISAAIEKIETLTKAVQKASGLLEKSAGPYDEACKILRSIMTDLDKSINNTKVEGDPGYQRSYVTFDPYENLRIAQAQGKIIQTKYPGPGQVWQDSPWTLCFDSNVLQYRIKPGQ